MRAKIKKRNSDGIVRLETGGELKEVLINEDIFNPDKETISLCFKGQNSSGIIDLSAKEADMVLNAIKGRVHLIKGIKKF